MSGLRGGISVDVKKKCNAFKTINYVLMQLELQLLLCKNPILSIHHAMALAP